MTSDIIILLAVLYYAAMPHGDGVWQSLNDKLIIAVLVLMVIERGLGIYQRVCKMMNK